MPKAPESFKRFLALASEGPEAKTVMDLLPDVEQLAKTEKRYKG